MATTGLLNSLLLSHISSVAPQLGPFSQPTALDKVDIADSISLPILTM